MIATTGDVIATGKLTAPAVDRAHREGQPEILCDGGGLYFRKQTRDGAAWTLRYRFAGHARWMTLGNYPDMSLADARVEAREKRAMLDKQRDPLLEKQAVVEQQRAAIVAQKARGKFRDLAEDWYQLRDVEGVYNTHDYLNERRMALEKWTAVLLAIEPGERKVSPMRRQVAG